MVDKLLLHFAREDDEPMLTFPLDGTGFHLTL